MAGPSFFPRDHGIGAYDPDHLQGYDRRDGVGMEPGREGLAAGSEDKSNNVDGKIDQGDDGEAPPPDLASPARSAPLPFGSGLPAAGSQPSRRRRQCAAAWRGWSGCGGGR